MMPLRASDRFACRESRKMLLWDSAFATRQIYRPRCGLPERPQPFPKIVLASGSLLPLYLGRG